MNWNSAADFWAMGGHAYFVWMCYGAAALLMLTEPLLARARHRRALRDAAAQADLDDQTAALA